MLPGTFRFELRTFAGGTHGSSVQVHIESLTHTIRGNYDVQFVLDPVAFIVYRVHCKVQDQAREAQRQPTPSKT